MKKVGKENSNGTGFKKSSNLGLKRFLKSAVAAGTLVQTKGKGANGSFKLSASGQKAKEPKKVVKKVKKEGATPAKKAKTPVKKATKPKSKPEKKKPAAAKKAAVKKIVKAKSPKKVKATKPKAPKPKKLKTPKKAAPKKAAKNQPLQLKMNKKTKRMCTFCSHHNKRTF
ncbi:hypothetical protein CDAR_288881 [Caerostris darwini]|uniref:H15 domain-containing protein n=1 Tax=Caerostris darwini TaxID=1538125 RepID=A0AAV4Q5Y3_9ARAC|nr:hypothetical protein CDAR_288881 [Caerostris darwini]